MQEQTAKLRRKLYADVNYETKSTTKKQIQCHSNCLKLPNGQKAKTDKENMSIFHPHFVRVYNNNRIVLPEALEFITKRDTYLKLDDPITWEEFKSAVKKMKNEKSPGANGVTTVAFKAINADNLQEVYDYDIVIAFWDGSKDYAEWHQAKGTPVPKTPNPG